MLGGGEKSSRVHFVPVMIERLEAGFSSLEKSIEAIRSSYSPVIVTELKCNPNGGLDEKCPVPASSGLGQVLLTFVTRLESYAAEIAEIADASDL